MCNVNLQGKRKRKDLNSAEWRNYVGLKGINLTELLMNAELKVSGKISWENKCGGGGGKSPKSQLCLTSLSLVLPQE